MKFHVRGGGGVMGGLKVNDNNDCFHVVLCMNVLF